jgi:GH15 family glucan-1,4-alpha-glucosidase
VSSTPIADHALLSDCHSAALVTRAGSVDWLCFPRFDSAATFARLLDDGAGHFSLAPVGEFRPTRRYLDKAMVLETTFETPTGTAILTDAMPVGRNERGHELGAEAPGALLRRVVCARGRVDLELEFAPRPEFGVVEPLLSATAGGVAGRGGAEVLMLSSPVALTITESTARGRFTLRSGEAAGFAVQHRTSSETAPQRWSQEEIAERIQDTAEAWRTWSDLHQGYEGPWRELVRHSGRVLQALTYYPTGAIVAAATTSLPESAGGTRNWDYRFTWVRDACLTMEAFWVAACPDEAHKFFSYLAGAALTQVRRGVDLQIMFGIGGEHDLTERELPGLAGWRGSRPVRIGNGAWNQRQLDVYGELFGAVHQLKDQLAELDPATRQFFVGVADTAAARWKERDQGIWEIRGEPRDFLYSKLMCWVALDRAIQLAGLLDARDRVGPWAATRDEIRRAILERGWSDKAQAFTQSFGSDDLDASNLMMPIVGFLPPTDPRLLSTLRATAERLTDDHGLVYRYRARDGLEGEEGTFLLCTFWLAEAWALAGNVERARETFARAAAFANDVGLLSEEVDPETGEMLGNFPQAFSHIGLVNAAWAINQAEERRRDSGPT